MDKLVASSRFSTRGRLLRALLAVSILTIHLIFATVAEAGLPVSHADALVTVDDEGHSDNVTHLARLATGGLPMANMAFQDDLVVMGEAYGFSISRILAGPPYLELISSYICPASEWADVSIWGDYVFMSIEDADPWASVRTYEMDIQTPDCNNTDFSTNEGGIRIVDISNPRWPRQIKFAEIPGGSESHALVPHRGKLFIYSQVPAGDVDESNPTTRFTILKFDPAHPKRIRAVGNPDTFPSYGCFDIAVLLGKQPMAACVMWGSTWLFDISDPANPRLLSAIELPAIGKPIGPAVLNPEAQWTSSAQFTWDGRYLVVADAADAFMPQKPSPCTGGQEDRRGVVWFYDISNPRAPKEVGYFSLPRTIRDRNHPCSAMSVSVLPMKDPGRYVAAVAWRMGGMDVVDFTDPENPRELAYWNGGEGPFAAAWYNGRIYVGAYQSDPTGLVALNVDGLGAGQVSYFDRRYDRQTQVKDFAEAGGWLRAARSRTTPRLRGSGPSRGGGSQQVDGDIDRRDQADPNRNYCAPNELADFVFDVNPNTWGEPFVLEKREGNEAIDLDIYFYFQRERRGLYIRTPWRVYGANQPGGERGEVPHYVRHAFVCIARGETVNGMQLPMQEASFVYRAGRT